MPIRPLSNRIVVETIKNEKTAGGIILSEKAQEKPQVGIAIAVGPGKILSNGLLCPPTVESGDKVLFCKNSGVEVKLNQKTFLLLTEEEVLGIIVD